MPKDQSLKVKGNICNIPIGEIENNFKSLLRPTDSNGIIVVKLKRKFEFIGHVLFELVRPRIIESFLNYLKLNNHLYRDIVIVMENLPTWHPKLEKLAEFQSPSLETTITTEIPTVDNIENDKVIK